MENDISKIEKFISDWKLFSLKKRILYLSPITLLYFGFLIKIEDIDPDSLLWLIPIVLPGLTTLYLMKLIWFNLVLGRIDTFKTKSIISIVFVVLTFGGFWGFSEPLGLVGRKSLIVVQIIDILYLNITIQSLYYLGSYFFLVILGNSPDRMRNIFFNDKYKSE